MCLKWDLCTHDAVVWLMVFVLLTEAVGISLTLLPAVGTHLPPPQFALSMLDMRTLFHLLIS